MFLHSCMLKYSPNFQTITSNLLNTHTMNHKLSVSHKKTLSKCFDEENHSPKFHHLSPHHHLYPGRHSTGAYIPSEPPSPLLSQSPESLWSRSPIGTPSHPSLLYCCISSLHRDGGVYSIVVSEDLVLTGSCSCRVHAWQPLDCHAIGYIHASSGEVRAMVAHGELLFTSHKDHKVRIWSMRSCSGDTFKPKKITTLPSTNHFKNFISRPTTPKHKVTGKPITSQHKDIISCMAYYSIEAILYTASFDTTVKAWRVNEKRCIDSFVAHGANINDMVINQQNGFLFTCSSDGTVKMWARVLGENSHALTKVLTCHAYPLHALALSVLIPSQETFLYSGSSDGAINYWEQDRSCRYTHGGILQGHLFAVLCLTTLENLVISGSEDSTIRVWKREIGGRNHECLAVLEGHRGPVRCLAAYLQKDKFGMSFMVYSASLDQTYKVWRVKLLPTESKKSPLRDDDMEDYRNNNHLGFETSPVLSPSWVKKKFKCRRNLHNKLV